MLVPYAYDRHDHDGAPPPEPQADALQRHTSVTGDYEDGRRYWNPPPCIAGGDIELGPGDKMVLPPHTSHAATVGPAGARSSSKRPASGMRARLTARAMDRP